MRKYFCLLVVIILLFSLCIPGYAQEAKAENSVMDVIQSQSTIPADDPLYDSANYTAELAEKLAGRDLREFAILPMYQHLSAYFEDMHKDLSTLEEMLSKATPLYLVFADELLVLKKIKKDDSYQISLYQNWDQMWATTPDFVTDILENAYYQNPNNQNNPLVKIICWNGYMEGDDIIIYYVGENSTQVWTYETPIIDFLSRSYQLPLEEFQIRVKEYSNYRIFGVPDNVGGGPWAFSWWYFMTYVYNKNPSTGDTIAPAMAGILVSTCALGLLIPQKKRKYQ